MKHNGEKLGSYQPAGEYIPDHVDEVVERLHEEGLTVEAHELMAASIDWAQTHKYYAKLIGYERTIVDNQGRTLAEVPAPGVGGIHDHMHRVDGRWYEERVEDE